ncbi:MarC family protein [Moritella viscosa]
MQMEIISAAVMLFLIMDPLGNLPIFLSILKHIDKKRRRAVMIRELLIALFVMLLFLFLGERILGFLSLKQEAVSIAGGIILFLIAIKMIFPTEGGLTGLAAVLLLAHQDPDKMFEWSAALLIAWGLSAFILMFYEGFNRILGEKGLAAVERLMGMLLVMISVQMLLDGIADYLAKVS